MIETLKFKSQKELEDYLKKHKHAGTVQFILIIDNDTPVAPSFFPRLGLNG